MNDLTRLRAETRATQRNPISLAAEYALYMMLKSRQALWKSALSAEKYDTSELAGSPRNLDASALPPYTSAVPANGRDFEPPCRRSMARSSWGWKRIFRDVAAL
jgi:hypothetical protein